MQQFVAGMPNICSASYSPDCIWHYLGSSTQAKTKAYFNSPRGPTPVESEDCLYFKVYTPASASTDAPMAVMFWLFGVSAHLLEHIRGSDIASKGDLRFCDSSSTYYNGSRLGYENDVIVVTFNYRTNSQCCTMNDVFNRWDANLRSLWLLKLPTNTI